jgi:hypothetical protein
MNSEFYSEFSQDSSSPVEILYQIDDMNNNKLLCHSATVNHSQQSYNQNYNVVKFLDTDLNELEQVSVFDVIEDSYDKNTVRTCPFNMSCVGRRGKDLSVKYDLEKFNDFKKNCDGEESESVTRYYSMPSLIGSIPIKPVKHKIKKRYFTLPGTSYVPKPRAYRGCLC